MAVLNKVLEVDVIQFSCFPVQKCVIHLFFAEESCESLGKAVPAKKGKENLLSADDGSLGDKKKHRRKNSKIRRAKKDKKNDVRNIV